MVITRQAADADLQQILDIYNDVIINTTAVYDYHPHTLEMRRRWFEEKRKNDYPVIVAEEEGRILGFCTFGPFRNWDAYKYSVENAVYVDEKARGRGVGKLLMAALIGAAKEKNMHTILAGIDASNEASIRLHESFGFREAGIFRQVGYKFNKWLDLVFLQLILDTPENPVSP